MLTWRQVWKRGSILRAILTMAVLVSVVPITLFAAVSISQNAKAMTDQAQMGLLQISQARANQIDAILKDARHSTYIAAAHAAVLLETAPSPAEVETRIARYQPDDRNVLGLDRFYAASGEGSAALKKSTSNVYWDNDVPLPLKTARQIVQTEGLDPIFSSIKQISPNTQWIYFTSTDGMMRLFPWTSNNTYPKHWDPRKILFYTIAEPSANPRLEARWTTPYVDFAGAGWMVTVTVPVLNARSELLGMMSHDITTEKLIAIATKNDLLSGAGYGFLIDQNGRVIAHPQHLPHDAKKGDENSLNLLQSGSPSFQRLAKQMVDGDSAYGYFYDDQNNEQLLAFAPISETGWSLGLVVPRTQVLSSVIEMRNRALLIGVLMIVVSICIAFLFTQQIYQPIQQLLSSVDQLSEDRERAEAPQAAVSAFTELQQLAEAFNHMATKIWQRETRLKAKVALFSIDIDPQNQSRQVEAIVESDYFKYLDRNADQLRSSLLGLGAGRPSANGGAAPDRLE